MRIVKPFYSSKSDVTYLLQVNVRVTANVRLHPPVTGTNLTVQYVRYASFESRVETVALW